MGGGYYLSQQISIIKLCLWAHGQLYDICSPLSITTRVYVVWSSTNLEMLVLPTTDANRAPNQAGIDPSLAASHIQYSSS